MFGRLSRPAVTRFAAVRSCSAPARVNLGGVTLERDCRSAARDAVTGASRRSPAVLKSQPDEFPGERPPRGQEENRRQGREAESVPCPHGLGRRTSVRTPYRSGGPSSTPSRGRPFAQPPEPLHHGAVTGSRGVCREGFADLFPRRADPDVLPEDRLQL